MLPTHTSLSPRTGAPLRRPVVPIRKQRGVIAIMFSVMIIVILGFMGLALDLSRLYNRKVELQAVADAAAVAAARKLVGTAAGLDEAGSAAAAAVARLNLNYNQTPVAWSSSAIKFGSSAAAGAWLDAGAAKASPSGVVFVKVDTAALGDDPGTIKNLFMRVVSDSLGSASTSATAIAGRSTINVTPLAVCAMSPDPATARANGELVQYGFRRGVAYDLMQLNPGAKTPLNFVINPIDTGGAAPSPSNTTPPIVGPFACSGSMPAASILSGQIRVSSPFPLGALHQHLNSRFDQYNGGHCQYRSAPPDFNIKPFAYDSAQRWMQVQPAGQSAAITGEANILRTVAELDPPNTVAATAYGTLWAYARPVPLSAYVAGTPEPAAGYTPFPKSDWPGLYIGAPAPRSNYPASGTPYQASGGVNFQAPQASHGRGQLHRRVLNVPLLACPVAAGANVNASVLAIGRFFMTVPATATTLSAEFAGIAAEGNLGGAVELYK